MDLIVGSNGIFQKYEDDLYKGVVKFKGDFFSNAMQIADGIYHCWNRVEADASKPKVEEEIYIKFKPIPISLWKKALKFLRWCYDEHKSEGFIAFTYRNEKWGLICPEQWDSAGGVCYHPEMHPAEACGIVGDVHSHPKFGSSEHSGTDHKDEVKNNGLFIVVRDFTIMTCDPMVYGTIRGNRFSINPDHVFDFSACDGDDDFPEEWKQRFHVGNCDACAKLKPVTTIHNYWPDRYRHGEDWRGSSRNRRGQFEKGSQHLFPEDHIDQVESMNDEVSDAFMSDPQKIIMDAYEIWSQDPSVFASDKSKRALFQCDNKGCEKEVVTFHCPECKKPVHEQTIVESVASMTNDVLVGEIESETSSDKNEVKSEEGGQTKEGEVKITEILSLTPDCGEKCPLKGYEHNHVTSGDLGHSGT